MKTNSKRLKQFLFILSLNFIITLLFSILYIIVHKRTLNEIPYLLLALLSNTFMIYSILLIVLYILTFIPGYKYILLLIFSIFHIVFTVDWVIYRFWDYHINSMVLNIITTPGGLDALNWSIDMKKVFIGIVIFWIFIEILILNISEKYSEKFNLRIFKKIILFLIFCFATDKITFAVSNIIDFVPVTKNRNVFPLYQPFTARKFAERFLGIKVDRKKLNFDISKSTLKYPKNEIKIKKLKTYPNIIIIIVDSMRYDMLDPEITPNIWEFAKKSAIFRNHYSGGNCTRFGIFSLFYGLYGNYWFKMVGERRGPILIDVLEQLDYEFKIFASARITFPEFDRTCFVKINRKDIYDNPPYKEIAKRDYDIGQKAVEFIENRKEKKPYFLFVFFDAPHGGYTYFPEFEKFKPSSGINILKLSKETAYPLFNKYKNSIYFDDYLIGKIISALEKTKDIRNSIVIITADHGEPFYERGYYGHNHSYSKEEISVPFIFYHPDIKHIIIDKKTSHLDLVPTIMRFLGIENPAFDYSQGIDLFSKETHKFIPAFSWSSGALIFDTYTVVISFSKLEDFKFYDNNTWTFLKPSNNNYLSDIIDFQKKFSEFN